MQQHFVRFVHSKTPMAERQRSRSIIVERHIVLYAQCSCFCQLSWARACLATTFSSHETKTSTFSNSAISLGIWRPRAGCVASSTKPDVRHGKTAAVCFLSWIFLLYHDIVLSNGRRRERKAKARGRRLDRRGICVGVGVGVGSRGVGIRRIGRLFRGCRSRSSRSSRKKERRRRTQYIYWSVHWAGHSLVIFGAGRQHGWHRRSCSRWSLCSHRSHFRKVCMTMRSRYDFYFAAEEEVVEERGENRMGGRLMPSVW